MKKKIGPPLPPILKTKHEIDNYEHFRLNDPFKC